MSEREEIRQILTEFQWGDLDITEAVDAIESWKDRILDQILTDFGHPPGKDWAEEDG